MEYPLSVTSLLISLLFRGKYQGIVGGVTTLGYIIGPLIGGTVTQKVGWRVRRRYTL